MLLSQIQEFTHGLFEWYSEPNHTHHLPKLLCLFPALLTAAGHITPSSFLLQVELSIWRLSCAVLHDFRKKCSLAQKGPWVQFLEPSVFTSGYLSWNRANEVKNLVVGVHKLLTDTYYFMILFAF